LSQQIYDKLHREAGATDHRLAGEDLGVQNYAVVPIHGGNWTLKVYLIFGG
jgi:hypothetical protein